ncbi:MAG: TRAM domain-containing protein [Candidatus Micrarchaeia archaeon]
MEEVLEGGTYDIRVDAKTPRGEGVGKIQNFVVFVKNAKTRIGKVYKIRITKVYRTFAYAEPAELSDNSKLFIGNGSLIIG